MRIITGKYKGRILTTVPDLSVRPVTDRVKSAIYNTLQNRLGIGGIRVLDLFAGSGSLGFEALSRGAAEAVFVENDYRVLKMLRANAEKFGCVESCSFVGSDAGEYLRTAEGHFDLIFIDPPYSDEQTASIPSLIMEKHLLTAGGYMIIEHTRRTVFPESSLYRKVLVREFGATTVSFITHPS